VYLDLVFVSGSRLEKNLFERRPMSRLFGAPVEHHGAPEGPATRGVQPVLDVVDHKVFDAHESFDEM
jgi:hypothetical protein